MASLDLERLVGGEALAESRIHLELLQRQLLFAEAAAKFNQADLDQVTRQIEQQRQQLERELAETDSRRSAALRALEAARESLRTAPGGAAASRVAELVSVREAQLDAADIATYVLRLMLESANVERTMWELRYAAYDSRNESTLRESGRRLSDFARRLDLWQNYAAPAVGGVFEPAPSSRRRG